MTMPMRLPLAAVLLSLVVAPALAAEEPHGCDKFKWPVERERALLTGPDAIQVMSGTDLGAPPATAVTLALAPLADAKLPMAPERPPKDPASFAGFVRIAVLPHPGSYLITLTSDAWIDAIQDGSYHKPAAFSGVLDCPGIRKSVKFDLDAGPLTVQLSRLPTAAATFTITPAD
jgi:hypothetical protein